jgi:hypothetical protein
LRLKAPALKSSSGLAQRIEAALRAVPSVQHVAANALTASLLIEFSPDALADPAANRTLFAALAEHFPDSFGIDWLKISIASIGAAAILKRVARPLAAAPGVREVGVDGDVLTVRFDPTELSIGGILERLAA